MCDCNNIKTPTLELLQEIMVEIAKTKAKKPTVHIDNLCKVKLLTPSAKAPSYAKQGDIGADLYADEMIIIHNGHRGLVSTGIAIEPSHGGYVRIAPRSGLSIKGVDIGAGIVDNSYRGEIKVLVINNTGDRLYINKGDKIAQAIFETAKIVPFELVSELGTSERGSDGFGSTGNN